VFDLAFHNLDRERAVTLWKKQLEEPKKNGNNKQKAAVLAEEYEE
jgi:hypothetical protein